MHSLKKILFLSLAVTLLFGMVGCGGAQPQAGPASVKVLTMQQAGPTPEEMDAIVAAFDEANPDIDIEIEYVAYDALHDKIVTSMASNPPAYDVILVDDIWYAEFAQAGYLKDVSDKITQDMRDKIFKAAWDITTVDGKVYGMPWLLDQKYFFYNKQILQEAGISAPPKTWEELLDQSRVIKEAGLVEYPIVWSWAQAETAVCDWVALLYGNSGSFLDESGQPAFNDDKGVETLTWMVQTVDEGLSNPASVSYVEEDVRNVFSQGKAAFAINWNYMFDLANFNAEESQVTGQVGVATIPVFKKAADQGIESASINGSMGFAVSANSPSADAAWKYIEYLTSESVQNEYSAHLLPIWQSSFQGEEGEKLQAISETTAVMVPAFNDQFPWSHVRPKVPYYPEGSKALQLAVQSALTKQMTPKEALDQAAAKWVELINSSK